MPWPVPGPAGEFAERGRTETISSGHPGSLVFNGADADCDVYEAFAGADEEKAREAEEALAPHHDRFAKIESKLDLHSWMIGAVAAMNIAMLVRLFVPG